MKIGFSHQAPNCLATRPTGDPARVAVPADSLYGEDRGLRNGLRKLQVPYVMALNPSHAWWHPEGVAGSLQIVARET
jgi:hypothetical protein